MTLAELEKHGEALFGWGWRSRMGLALGFDKSTLYHYATGDRAIPLSAALHIRLFARAVEQKIIPAPTWREEQEKP